VETLSARFHFREEKRMETQLYDVEAAAQMLAISPWTVRAIIRSGRLPAVRIGRLVRLEGQELERFVASAKNSGDSFTNSKTKEQHIESAQ
jgi:excisionase family DNA binding protein